jgi:hypothetical protein
MTTTIARIADVALIGHDDGSTFSDLLRFIRQHPQLHLKAEYSTLKVALDAGLGQTLQADFVIVLQSWSDQFAQHEINELIGRMLFKRILCCYGPWCTADGRSHELWPVAFRVPVASAASLMDLELIDFSADTPPLFPMSAGEEVYAHRSRFPVEVDSAIRREAVVVSDDSELRTTVAAILATLHCDTTILPLADDAIREHLKTCTDIPELVIVDFDGVIGDLKACLDVLRSEARHSAVVGMSVFAASLLTETTLPAIQPSQVVEKTELLLQLRGIIKTLPPSDRPKPAIDAPRVNIHRVDRR